MASRSRSRFPNLEGPGLAKGTVHVWCASFEGPPAPAESDRGLLDEEERGRLSRFRGTALQEAFARRRALLRRILAGYLDVEPADIVYASEGSGKPCLGGGLAASGLSFNASRSGPWALVAVARSFPVGVDVEEHARRGDYGRLAPRILTARELAFLEARDEGLRQGVLLDLWTKKEAFLKALGAGLSIDPRDVEVPLEAEGPARCRRLAEARDPGLWHVMALSLGAGTSTALCTQGRPEEVVVLRWSGQAEEGPSRASP